MFSFLNKEKNATAFDKDSPRPLLWLAQSYLGYYLFWEISKDPILSIHSDNTANCLHACQYDHNYLLSTSEPPTRLSGL